MMHPQDEANICRVLDRATIPADVCREYEKRRHMRMRFPGGAVGTMGCGELIDMLRHLGYEAPKPVDRNTPQGIDWHKVERGTEVLVDKNGTLNRGKFLGLSVGGQLDVSFEGDPIVRECSPKITRLVPNKEQDQPRFNSDYLRPDDEVGVEIDGELRGGTIRRLRKAGRAEVTIEGDDKKFRVVSLEQLRPMAVA